MRNKCTLIIIYTKNINGKAIDKVLNFHLSNGAYIKYINYQSNLYSYGVEQSSSFMCNYYYDINLLEKYKYDYINNNHIRYDKEIDKLIDKYYRFSVLIFK